MAVLNRFRDDEPWWKVHLDQVAERDIYKFLGEAESFLEDNPTRGVELFKKANTLYHEKGYDFDIECRINDVFLLYVEKGLLPEA